jgi:hypothetical protein
MNGPLVLRHDPAGPRRLLRCAEAETLARDGQVLADELGYRLSALRLKSLLATVAAARGDADTVAAITGRILQWSEPRQLGLLQVSVWQALGLLALGQQDYDTAYHWLAQVSPPGTLPPLNPRAIWSVYDLIEAAARSGRLAQTRLRPASSSRVSRRGARRSKLSLVSSLHRKVEASTAVALSPASRNTNRRHMIDDHHGRTAGRATLLARAMDEIFATRSVASVMNLQVRRVTTFWSDTGTPSRRIDQPPSWLPANTR